MAAFTCRRLLIPGGDDWLAIVTGALNELIYARSFEQFGAYTPDQTASLFSDMFDDFCFNVDPGCRMIGEIVCLAFTPSPAANWLPADGRSLVRADYPDLFSAIGVTFGATDGAHFNIPDLQGRTIIGTGTGTGLTPRAEGDRLGEENHVITVSELASHTHTDVGHTHSESAAIPTAILVGVGAPVPSALPSIGITGIGSASLTNTGSDTGHNTMQPSLALSYFIVVY
jgi:microcystin-dependent protein